MDREKKNDIMRTLYWAAVFGWIWEIFRGFGAKNRPEPSTGSDNVKPVDPDLENGWNSMGCGIILLLIGILCGITASIGAIASILFSLFLLIFGFLLRRRNATGEDPESTGNKRIGGLCFLIAACFVFAALRCMPSFLSVFLGVPGAISLIIGIRIMWNGR